MIDLYRGEFPPPSRLILKLSSLGGLPGDSIIHVARDPRVVARLFWDFFSQSFHSFAASLLSTTFSKLVKLPHGLRSIDSIERYSARRGFEGFTRRGLNCSRRTCLTRLRIKRPVAKPQRRVKQFAKNRLVSSELG